MPEHSIYKDISQRTGGNIYLGIVGPVRTGKSTFIRKFMECLVLPSIEDQNDQKRAQDSMPQSGSGKTVMTAEPKFVPDEGVELELDKCRVSVRLVDCVGYVVDGAAGLEDENGTRMVRTPWSEEPLPFEQAAHIGTEKVIKEHSSVAILVTTDGSICGIPRENYVDAEKQVARELSAQNKPFAIVLNSKDPLSKDAQELAMSLEKEYKAPVALVNCLELDSHDIREILSLILMEFPVRSVNVAMPEWTMALEKDHELIVSIKEALLESVGQVRKTGELKNALKSLDNNEYVDRVDIMSIDMGTGDAFVSLFVKKDTYYETITELTGIVIDSEKSLISNLCRLADIEKKYNKIESALEEASRSGYGIVVPDASQITLDEPKIVRHAGGYGVQITATAPSLHMIRANIETKINPVVGTRQQSEDLVNYLLQESEQNPDGLFSTNLFGRSLWEHVSDGISEKLDNMPPEAREKMGQTLARIINEGSGGLVCIIL